MNREKAAHILDGLAERLDIQDIKDWRDAVDALLLGAAALRGPEWVRTADRLPTEADAGYNEEVVTLYRDSDTELAGCDYWKYVAKHPEYFPYWMPLPKLPEVEE